ncbi:MAG: hypothetical protein WCF57_00220, partial [Pyrinomonadaceae bacterium]
MKNPLATSKLAVARLATFVLMLSAFAAMPLLSRAHQPQAASITVVNNSGWEIRYLYLSPADSD